MGIAYNTSIVRDGLVLHLDAANVKSYPGTGTTWFDLSKNGYIFTSTNPPTFVDNGSVGGKYFEYSGAGKYFDSTTNSPFSGSNFAISVVAVVSQYSTGSYYSILSQNEQDGFDSMSFLSLNGKFGTDHWSPGGRRLITAANNNTVYHVTWTVPSWSTHQDSTTKIYINGIEQNTEEYSRDTVGSLVSDVFRVGNWQLNRTDMDFQGRIYTIKVYNKALTEEEVKQNFKAYRGRYGI